MRLRAYFWRVHQQTAADRDKYHPDVQKPSRRDSPGRSIFVAKEPQPFCLSASPRMSPSDAPLSDEPYCATACFSSAICNALTEKLGFFARSKPVTLASNFWP